MKRKSSLPEVSAEALRDHGTEERIDRIWRRLESDLSTSPARPRAVLWWAPAAVLIVFGSGVMVGARWGRDELPPPATVLAEPAEASEEPASAPDLPEPFTPAQEEKRDRQQHLRAPHTPVEPETPAIPELVEPLPLPTSAAPVMVSPPAWYAQAEVGNDKGALAAIEREGGFDVVIPRATPDQLMVLADIARATGLPARRLQALRRVVEQFPGDPNASLAAYSLGTELEKAGDRAGAARAFAAYRALSPKGDFAEDALARQVEAAIEQGNVELARQLADEYAKDFPKGRRLGELRAQIAKLTGEPTKAPAKAGASSAPPADDEGPSEEPE